MCFLGGKSAPAYVNATTIIKLVGHIGQVVNNDPDLSPPLEVGFVPNYSVIVVQMVGPASDLLEHTPTGGTEASGTSNRKFVMNGDLLLGTMGGAHSAVREEGGNDPVFIFGCHEDEVEPVEVGTA